MDDSSTIVLPAPDAQTVTECPGHSIVPAFVGCRECCDNRVAGVACSAPREPPLIEVDAPLPVLPVDWQDAPAIRRPDRAQPSGRTPIDPQSRGPARATITPASAKMRCCRRLNP